MFARLRKKLRIWRLKRRARSLAFQENYLWVTYDCGEEMINHITGGRLQRIQTAYRATLLELMELDPRFPR